MTEGAPSSAPPNLGLLNLRDVGACVTMDGRVVAPGQVFRSAEPVALTPMAAILRRIGGRAAAGQDREVPAALLRAPAEAMERFLDQIRVAHGTAEGLLANAGLGETTATALRQRLLV
jgi:Tyrosine phosphatase family